MKINATLQEPTLIKVQSISDDRGLLIPFTDYIDHDLFHRCYMVEDYGRGVVRGLHYHKLEAKIFTIASGAELGDEQPPPRRAVYTTLLRQRVDQPGKSHCTNCPEQLAVRKSKRR